MIKLYHGFEIDVQLDNGAYMPTKAHSADAGFDLKSRENKLISAHDSQTFDTGVHVAIPEGYVGFLMSKSGLNIKNDLTGTGVIDSGYTGSIVVKLYNNGSFNHTVKKGDKIIQLVILPTPIIYMHQVESLAPTERGDNGFGSTGI